MIVAGVGFRAEAASRDIADIVHRAQAQSGLAAHWLAVPDFKLPHVGVLEAAAALNLRLIAIERSRLEAVQGRCLTRSLKAAAATGLASIAEACALAALDDQAKLILPRMANTHATCALAQGRSW